MKHSDECMIWEHQPAGYDGWHDCTCHVFNSIHDPLCLASDGGRCIEHAAVSCPCDCQCNLIVKVRDNERRQAVERVRAEKGKFPSTRLDWDTIVIAILDGTKLRLSKKELGE